jgi:hypothetical protein
VLLQWLGFGLAFAGALAGVAGFFVKLVRGHEKKIDQLYQTIYDPMGMNGMIRKVKALEEMVNDLDLRFEQAEANSRRITQEEILKIVDTLERIYQRKLP